MAIEINLATLRNCDDVQLTWRSIVDETIDAEIEDCIGFSIERQRRLPDGNWAAPEILRNRVGFSNQTLPEAANGSAAVTKPSNVWPFQRYDWTDHGANSGQTVRYRVAAMKLPPAGTPGTSVLAVIARSKWSEAVEVSADAGEGISAYFNRGAVMSQFVARIARERGWTARQIKEHIKDLEEPLRRFLAGELRVALLDLLDQVIEDPRLELYAALYELSDEELIGRLRLLRGRAHIVLANGSDKQGDGNAAAREKLVAAGVDVRDRLLGSKGLGHNKFAVVVRTTDNVALKAWTGSTNWAATGLATQLNNAIVFDNQEIAEIFRLQWEQLAAAENGFPKELVESNAQSPFTSGSTDVWFTRVRNASKKNTDAPADQKALVELVKSAKQAILYVMFQPGAEPLGTLVQAANSLYVRGVVSTLASTTEEKFALMGIDTTAREFRTRLVQPEGIVKTFSAWVKEVTRSQFLFPNAAPGVGHAITHAKMIVIDPMSDDCKVITGSHNFSISASEKNDENFVVVRGNRRLAEAYAVACLSTYAHYRWRAYVKEKLDAEEEVWDHLSEQPGWQGEYLTAARKRHLELWCGA